MSLVKKIIMPNTSEYEQSQRNQSLEKKKEILKNQIKELERLKDGINQRLTTFASLLENKHQSVSSSTEYSENQLKEIDNFKIKNELFKLAGIQCAKYSKNEYVFHFFAQGEGKETHTYSVQFFNIDKQGELGKWVLPTFIDINCILQETPLDNIANALQFLQNCKHYIDCYHNRRNQFVTLEKSLETITNCIVVADLSYKYINIEFFSVHDVEFDNYINIIVYLTYDLKEARPHQITVDSRYGPPLQKNTEKYLKTFLKPFKKFSLSEAFENIEKKKHFIFSWKRLEKNQTLLDEQESENESSVEIFSLSKRPRSISVNSEEQNRDEINYRKRRKSISYEKKSSVKKGAIKKRRDRMEENSKKVDISRFFTKKDKDEIVFKRKDSEKPGNNELEKENSEEPKLSKEISKPSIKKTIGHSKITPMDSNVETMSKVNRKKALRRDPVLENISELDISKEGRVLRSATSSPKKGATPKKISPQKVKTSKRLVSPKKISFSKKLEAVKKAVSSEIEISPITSKTIMKQTNLKFKYPSTVSPSPKTETVKIDYKGKVLNSKVVTSTPMPINRKRSIEGYLDISEIKSNKHPQTVKPQIKKIPLNKSQKTVLTGKPTAKRVNRQSRQVKNRQSK